MGIFKIYRKSVAKITQNAFLSLKQHHWPDYFVPGEMGLGVDPSRFGFPGLFQIKTLTMVVKWMLVLMANKLLTSRHAPRYN